MVKKNTVYFDENTGEVYREYNKFMCEPLNDKGYLFGVHRNCVREYCDQQYPAGMTINDIGRFSLLVKHTWKNTNMLAIYKRAGVVPMQIEQMAKVVQLTQRRAITYINKLIDLGLLRHVAILKENGEKEFQYYVSPLYKQNGTRVSLNLYLIFRDQLDTLLPPWVIKEFAKADSKQKEV